jgi:hypothetical protein
VFEIGIITFRPNEAGMYATFKSQRSPVARHIRHLGDLVQVEAKKLVGVDTGLLRRSIVRRRDRSVTGEYGVVVKAAVPYAFMHHTGTRPHTIVAPPGRVMTWRNSGGRVYARVVKHPGTKPNPYLLTALKTVVR